MTDITASGTVQPLPIEPVADSPLDVPKSERDPGWFKRAVFYEVFVRSFQDASGDGVGDFKGLISAWIHRWFWVVGGCSPALMTKDALRAGRMGLSRVQSSQFERHLSGAIFSCRRARLGLVLGSEPDRVGGAGAFGALGRAV